MTEQHPPEQAFAALTSEQREQLLRQVFLVLEYDEDGNPGREWSADTGQALGDLFNNAGIVLSAEGEAATTTEG